MPDIEINTILNRLRRSLILPYTLFITATVAVFFLMLYSAKSLDLYSDSTEKALFNNIYNKELEALGKLNKDYSFWNDMVEKTIFSQDQQFIIENFLGPYLLNSFEFFKSDHFKSGKKSHSVC